MGKRSWTHRRKRAMRILYNRYGELYWFWNGLIGLVAFLILTFLMAGVLTLAGFLFMFFWENPWVFVGLGALAGIGGVCWLFYWIMWGPDDEAR